MIYSGIKQVLNEFRKRLVDDNSVDTERTWSGAKIASEIEKDIKNVYSTKETVIGTWKDGKPLYRLTIEYTTAVNLFEGWTPIINSDNIKECVKARWGNYNHTYNGRITSRDCAVCKNVSTNKIEVFEDYFKEGQSVDTIILEYTKEQDSPTEIQRGGY